MSRLALGTVQFGLDYGISNARGQVPRDEAFAILDECARRGVDTLDTAQAYGQSEEVLGQYLAGKANGFRVVTKLPKCSAEQAEGFFQTSLQRLRAEKVYGCLVHNFAHYLESPGVWQSLQSLKARGLAQKVGFSLYSPDELEHLMNSLVEPDLVQVPFSVFDQRFQPYFPLLKQNGVEIHVRSLFLQGLVFKKPGELTGNLVAIGPKLAGLREISEKSGLPIHALCLGAGLLDEHIDRVVVGVDSLANFTELADAETTSVAVKPHLADLLSLRETDENILLPMNWKLA